MTYLRANPHAPWVRRPMGVSLIELMIALVIASLLSLGMIQIFMGSKVAYQVQEGLSRIQENGRFSLQYLERNVRLAGYMGCGSDIVRVPPNDPANANYPFDTHFINHLAAHGATPTPEVRFQRPIEGFNANAVPANTALAVGAKNLWTPPLPDGLDGKVVKGSDVLILRVFGEDSTPVVGFFSNDGTFSVADGSFVKAGNIYGIENCGATRTYGFSEIFQAATASTSGGVTAPLGGLNVLTAPGSTTQTWNHGIGFTGPISSQINASVHDALYMAIYVGLRTEADGTQSPALFVQRFQVKDGAIQLTTDELADGIENMQLQFGLDTTVPRDDTVDTYATADTVIDGAVGAEAQDAKWQQVISVRVGLLIRGQNSDSGTNSTSHAAGFPVAGTAVIPLSDHRLRQVYETTISLRNRIFNS